MQTITTFDEKLATILIKKIAIGTLRVNYNQSDEWHSSNRFRIICVWRSSCGVRAAIIFDRTLAMKSESVGHHAATQALVLSIAGVTAIALVASLILLILH